jgi:hypothetical protein
MSPVLFLGIHLKETWRTAFRLFLDYAYNLEVRAVLTALRENQVGNGRLRVICESVELRTTARITSRGSFCFAFEWFVVSLERSP